MPAAHIVHPNVSYENILFGKLQEMQVKLLKKGALEGHDLAFASDVKLIWF